MERRRALAGSPPPSIQKTVSCGSLLDNILSRNTTDLSASNNFGLLAPYRHPKYKPHNLARFGGSLPNSPRARPLSPLAMSKSVSTPLERFLPDAAPQPPAAAEPTNWTCTLCGNSDISTLTRSADSFMACPCGAVADVTRVSQVRSKNCPKSEDKTQVADAPVADARTAEVEALSNGPESADARRRRLLDSAGGTRCLSHQVLKKRDLSRAQNHINQTTARDMRDRLEKNQRDAIKQRAILRAAEAVFDQLPGLDDRIKKHVRFEAMRIHDASLAHDQKCGGRGCLLSIAPRSSNVVGACIVEHVLQKLHDPESTLLAEKAPEVTQQQLGSFLSQTKTLQLRHASANQRLQVLSAVGIVSGWTQEECCRPCPPPEPPPPPMLRMPPSMAGTSDYGSGKCKSADPADFMTCKLRDCVISASKIAPPLAAKVRNAALEALLFKPVVAFLTSYAQKFEMPADVVAICLTVAATRKLKRDDPPPPWHKDIYRQNNVARHTVKELTDELTRQLSALPEVKDEGDIF